MIDVVDNCYSCFPRSGELGLQELVSYISGQVLEMYMGSSRISLLLVDQVRNLQV